MKKEITLIYSIWGTIFIIFFLTIGWGTFITVTFLQMKQGFQSRDLIGMGASFLIYLSISLVFIFGVLKYTLVKYKLDFECISIKKPFKNTVIIKWKDVHSITKGRVPSYLYGSTNGYIIKTSIIENVKEIYLIKERKVTQFLELLGKDATIDLTN